jgi:D-alanyl-D-alanine carboxypeptidase
MNKLTPEFLNQTIQHIIQKKNIFSTVLCVESGDGCFSWTGAAGNMQENSPYFIASVTKLYVTAVVMRLIEEQMLDLNDRISKYLPEEYMKGLHVLRGVDYSDQITVNHLISNTSGLPDYFFHKQPDGKTAAENLLGGKDESWYLEKTIEIIKKLKPNFKPGKKGKASYSDTNYQLLGKIIEVVARKSIVEVFREIIFDELDLHHTYSYKNTADDAPVPFYYKSKKIWIPEYMASITPEGGIVSTAEESMLFLKEFFKGRFFAKEKIENLKKWNLIFPPPGLFLYGVGLEKLWIPRIVSPFKPIKEILGFWGQTGSFAWYNPQTDLYFCGTTNQIDGSGHAAAGKAIWKIIKAVL